MTRRFMRLRKWMLYRGVNQLWLAEQLHKSPSQISRIMGRGDQDFTIDDANVLERLTAIPAVYFLRSDIQKVIKDSVSRLRPGVENAG